MKKIILVLFLCLISFNLVVAFGNCDKDNQIRVTEDFTLDKDYTYDTADVGLDDGSCFIIDADNLIFNCNGNEIEEQNCFSTPDGTECRCVNTKAVTINNKKNVTIKNCKINKFTEKILIEDSENIRLSNNKIWLPNYECGDNSKKEVVVKNSNLITLNNNQEDYYVMGMGFGYHSYDSMIFEDTQNINVFNNILGGIKITNSQSNNEQNINISDNIFDYTLSINNSNNINIQNNQFNRTDLNLKSSTDILIKNNDFFDLIVRHDYITNASGVDDMINADYSNNVLIEDNYFNSHRNAHENHHAPYNGAIINVEKATNAMIKNNHLDDTYAKNNFVDIRLNNNKAYNNLIRLNNTNNRQFWNPTLGSMAITVETNGEVKNNTIEMMRTGVYASGTNIIIEKNKISGGQPIYIEGINNEILKNLIQNSRSYGIHVRAPRVMIDGCRTVIPTNNIIKYNTIKNNEVGINIDSHTCGSLENGNGESALIEECYDRYNSLWKYGLFQDIIEYNNIFDNSLNFRNDISPLAYDISTKNNYWGTTDAEEIRPTIWGYDRDPRVGKVEYCQLLNTEYPEGQTTTCLNEEKPKSSIENTGSESLQGYLTIQIRNGSTLIGPGVFMPTFRYVLNDLEDNTLRTIQPGQKLHIKEIFEELETINAESIVGGGGIIWVKFVDENGNTIIDSNGDSFSYQAGYSIRRPFLDTGELPIEIPEEYVTGAQSRIARQSFLTKIWNWISNALN